MNIEVINGRAFKFNRYGALHGNTKCDGCEKRQRNAEGEVYVVEPFEAGAIVTCRACRETPFPKAEAQVRAFWKDRALPDGRQLLRDSIAHLRQLRRLRKATLSIRSELKA